MGPRRQRGVRRSSTLKVIVFQWLRQWGENFLTGGMTLRRILRGNAGRGECAKPLHSERDSLRWGIAVRVVRRLQNIPSVVACPEERP